MPIPGFIQAARIIRNKQVMNQSPKNLFISAQHLYCSSQSKNKPINLIFCVVYSERNAHSSGYIEKIHQGIGAKAACTHGNSHFIEHCSQIERMNTCNIKRNDTRFVSSFSVNAQSIHLFQLPGSISQKLLFPFNDIVKADFLK